MKRLQRRFSSSLSIAESAERNDNDGSTEAC